MIGTDDRLVKDWTSGQDGDGLLPELSDAEYAQLGVMPLSRFSKEDRERINEEASGDRRPAKWYPPKYLGPLWQMESRAWFEWFIRRGRDPRKARPRIPSWMRDSVVRRDGMICKLCGLEIASKADLHIDHIQPLSKGGPTTPGNLQPAHAACNVAKSNRWVEDDE